MTVEYVTHLLETGEVMVMGHVEDVWTVTGQRVSRVGAVEGQEQQNPPAVHVNFETLKKGEHPITPEMLVLAFTSSDAIELGMLLVAMEIEDIRAMAMLWNFHPYCRKVQAQVPHSKSPFEDLNGFRYHDHWLRNLLIASSLNGRHTGKPVSHKPLEN